MSVFGGLAFLHASYTVYSCLNFYSSWLRSSSPDVAGFLLGDAVSCGHQPALPLQAPHPASVRKVHSDILFGSETKAGAAFRAGPAHRHRSIFQIQV